MSILSAIAFDSKKLKPAGLSRLSLAVGLIELILGVSVLVIGLASKTSYQVVSAFASKDTLAEATGAKAGLVTASRHLFDVNLVFPLALLLLIAAAGHILSFSRARQSYEAGLSKEVNKQRMYILAPLLGLFGVNVGLLVGMSDLGLLLAVFSLAAFIPYLVFNVELQISSNAKNVSTRLLLLPVAMLMLLLTIYLYVGEVYGLGVNSYSYISGLLFGAYLASIYIHNSSKNKKSADFLRKERSMLVGTLLAETLLSLIVIFYVF